MNLDMSNQPNSGLLRFRSAPSSLFANFNIGVEKGSSESNDGLTSSRFPLGGSGGGGGGGGNLMMGHESFQDLIEGGGEKGILGNGYSLNNEELPPPHYHPRQSCSNSAGMEDDSCFRVISSIGLDNHHHHQIQAPPKMGSSLLRQNSSPAGLFSHLTPQNGFNTIRGIGSYRGLGLSRISEIESDTVGESVHNDNKVGNGNGENQFYGSDYPFSSWNDSSHFVENFTGLKQEVQDDDKLFLGAQNGKFLNRPPMLSHHLSLPKVSGEMAAMEKFLHFQDSVPCKIRAKRGCATHPRSIAERVRRTRISERMRKLQELVPNMDKQTNTADMLDLAVDYIKDLQKQYKTLNDKRENCRCSGMRKPVQI